MMIFVICNLLFVIPSLILVLIIFSRLHVTKLMIETKIFFSKTKYFEIETEPL